MAAIIDKATKLVGDAYYGEGAAIGDGKFLEMLLKFFSTILGSCPLGARRAHRMLNGGPFQQARATARLEYQAYEWTSGDEEQTAKIIEVSKKMAKVATEDEFAKFASVDL